MVSSIFCAGLQKEPSTRRTRSLLCPAPPVSPPCFLQKGNLSSKTVDRAHLVPTWHQRASSVRLSGASCCQDWANLVATWSPLDATWPQRGSSVRLRGATCCQNRANVDRTWAQRGSSVCLRGAHVANVGASWSQPGPNLAQLNPKEECRYALEAPHAAKEEHKSWNIFQ